MERIWIGKRQRDLPSFQGVGKLIELIDVYFNGRRGTSQTIRRVLLLVVLGRVTLLICIHRCNPPPCTHWLLPGALCSFGIQSFGWGLEQRRGRGGLGAFIFIHLYCALFHLIKAFAMTQKECPIGNAKCPPPPNAQLARPQVPPPTPKPCSRCFGT